MRFVFDGAWGTGKGGNLFLMRNLFMRNILIVARLAKQPFLRRRSVHASDLRIVQGRYNSYA